ncbi:hypothetical protein [Methyloceanibacter sp.]|jgi:hypothetical protein|uniref:hypothetical protein n=1 Tax=Methyloceanibacter sp. TaxID=1965321 RepID=UPI00351B08AD
MRHVLTGIAVGALALGLVSLTPDTASAKRNYGWGWGGGPGVNIYIGPRHSYEPRYKYRKYGYRKYPRYWGESYGYGPRYKYRNPYY